MHKLFLLDAMALIYRAHFAFSKNPRVNSKGMNTGAVLGFTNTLLDLLKREKPSHIGVAFDTPEPTFRHIEFKEYKANRQEQPEDITSAIPYVYKMVEAFQIPILVKPGFEADDIIGTIAKKAAHTGEFEVYMMTPDKDYAQLVEEKIFLYKPAFIGNGIDIWGIPEVLKKFDIERIDQVIDFLGLQGDSVDNIPGIPGVGPKTAVKFLKAYGSVEGLIANVDQLKGKQKEKVSQFAEQGLLSKKLATIDIHVPVDFDPEALKLTDPNDEQVISLFDELEFRTLKKRLYPEKKSGSKKGDSNQIDLFAAPKTQNHKRTEPQHYQGDKSSIRDSIHHYYCIDSPEGYQQLADLLARQQEFCFDTETTSINAIDAELVGIAFATYPGEAYYVPIPAHLLENPSEEVISILSHFQEVFANPQISKIG
ncbi:MAG: 5'-3' exonuclease H3TH domain-containing protein, partial [Bacteroidota bacterium]